MEAQAITYPKDPIIEEVLQRIAARADVGITKFGISVTDAQHPIAYWIDNAIEEAMDLAVYLTKLKHEMAPKEVTRQSWVCHTLNHTYGAIPCPRCKPLMS